MRLRVTSELQYDQGFMAQCDSCIHQKKWTESDDAYGHEQTIKRLECELPQHQHPFGECEVVNEMLSDIKNVEEIEVL